MYTIHTHRAHRDTHRHTKHTHMHAHNNNTHRSDTTEGGICGRVWMSFLFAWVSEFACPAAVPTPFSVRAWFVRWFVRLFVRVYIVCLFVCLFVCSFDCLFRWSVSVLPPSPPLYAYVTSRNKLLSIYAHVNRNHLLRADTSPISLSMCLWIGDES
jgi:hypothetical protein